MAGQPPWEDNESRQALALALTLANTDTHEFAAAVAVGDDENVVRSALLVVLPSILVGGT